MMPMRKVEELHEQAQNEGYEEGYGEAKHEIIEYLTYKM